ncbi:MAG: hypothetical protein ACFFAN_01380 [Promethearchaeota archaeon]
MVNKISKSLILYTLLNRIPLIIFTGFDENNCLAILRNLAKIVFFRDVLILNREVRDNKELDKLINAEEIEDLSNRYTIIGYTNDYSQLQKFKDFTSFIIATNNIKEADLEILIPQSFLGLYIDTKSTRLFTHELNVKEMDLSFEEFVLNKINSETSKPLDDIVYLLKTQLDLFKVSEESEIWKNTLDISKEREAIRNTILQTELQKFISASEKIYMLLRKANQFEEIDKKLNIKINANDLVGPIGYNNASIARMISFIEANWRNDYSKYLI